MKTSARCDMLNRGTKSNPGKQCRRTAKVDDNGFNISTLLAHGAVCCSTHAKILKRGELVQDRHMRYWHWSQETMGYTCSLPTTSRLKS